MIISNISGHHSGGLGNDQYASTEFLTPEDIAKYHKRKWDSPSKYMTGTFLSYAGYNVIYDAKTREWHQCRAIGEQTIAQRGHNEDTFSFCVIGNFNAQNGKSVDPMTEEMEKDIASFLHDLINGNKRNLIMVAGVKLNFSIKRIYAHRFFGWTSCYGSFLADNWAQELVIKYKKVVRDPTVASSIPDLADLKERLALTQTLLRLYTVIFDLINKMKLQKQSLGSIGDDKECEGFITI